MMSDTTKPDSRQPAAEMAVDLFDNWFDPIVVDRKPATYYNVISSNEQVIRTSL